LSGDARLSRTDMPDSLCCGRPAMRIVTWNIAKRPAPWQFLEELEADVALLQEAIPPHNPKGQQLDLVSIAPTREGWRSMVAAPTYREVHGRGGRWGSAILSRTAELEAYEPHDSMPWLRMLWGGTAVARLTDPPIWLASIHSDAGPVRADQLGGRSIEALRRCDLKHILEIELVVADLERLFSGSRFIAGGDLNASLALDANYHPNNPSNARLFANLAEAGFVDLRPRFFEDEQQTWFKAGTGPYQLDHVFADADTEKRVVSWRVIHEAVEREPQLSDHAPIEVIVAE
jgi:endonuclease/exonuclease/phosphatase family metal-dependent hydrolase